MSTDPFHRSKRQPGCLSRRTVALFAIGELDEQRSNQVQAHLDQCESCKQRVQQERQQVEEARLERIPEAVLAAAEQRSRADWNWQWTTALAGAAAAVLLLVMFLPSGPPDTGPTGGIRIKGKVALLATVERNGKRIADQLPFDRLPPIQANDAFRLKASGPLRPHLALRACERQQCELLFQGTLPADGWLPLGLTATEGDSRLELVDAPSRAELRTCLGRLGRRPAATDRLDNCGIHSFELTVGPADTP